MDWTEVLRVVFEVIVFPVLSAAGIYFITWINAKKKELQKKTENETAQKYLEMLNNTITECVLATNQTYVDALKKEGTFDEAAQKKAFQITYEAVVGVLTDEAQKYLGEAVNDITAYITTKIEAQVGMYKK